MITQATLYTGRDQKDVLFSVFYERFSVSFSGNWTVNAGDILTNFDVILRIQKVHGNFPDQVPGHSLDTGSVIQPLFKGTAEDLSDSVLNFRPRYFSRTLTRMSTEPKNENSKIENFTKDRNLYK